MFKLRINFILIALSIYMCGCAGVTLIEDRKKQTVSRVATTQVYSVNIPFIRQAVVTPVDLSEECRSPAWKSVDMTPGILGVIVPVLTLSIVVPAKVKVWCSAAL